MKGKKVDHENPLMPLMVKRELHQRIKCYASNNRLKMYELTELIIKDFLRKKGFLWK